MQFYTLSLFHHGFWFIDAAPAHCTLEGVPQFSFMPHFPPRFAPSLASIAVPRLQPLQAVATCSTHLVRRPRPLWCKISVLLSFAHGSATQYWWKLRPSPWCSPSGFGNPAYHQVPPVSKYFRWGHCHFSNIMNIQQETVILRWLYVQDFSWDSSYSGFLWPVDNCRAWSFCAYISRLISAPPQFL